MSTGLTHSNIKHANCRSFSGPFAHRRYWVLDSECAFPFIFNSLIYYLHQSLVQFHSDLKFKTTFLTTQSPRTLPTHSTTLCYPRHTSHKMRRYITVALILLILSAIDFALAVPVQITEKCQVCADVVHVPKDAITVLGKRGDRWKEMVDLFENFDRWWAGAPYTARPPSVSAPLKSGGSMQAHAPPPSPASSTESDQGIELSVWHPPTPSPALSTESDSGLKPPPPSPASLTESEEWHTPPLSPGSDSDSDSGRWSTISNAPSAGSVFENLLIANDELKLKGLLPAPPGGAVNEAQSELSRV